LAKQADFILNTSVEKEACPHNLAPTTSTTAQLAMGDALAICLLEARSFNTQDFARYHPGGSLGKRLYLKAGDIAKKMKSHLLRQMLLLKMLLLQLVKTVWVQLLL
jgi:arabinose-5-phosphate isomerase